MRPATASVLPPSLQRAVATLQEGGFIMLYDGDDREGEVDLFLPAQHASPAGIRRLRTQAGGLVFVALGPDVHDALGLPFLHDLYREAADRWELLGELVPERLPYDARSSFSLTINHRETFTGITDRDRALTVSDLGRLASLEPCLSADALRARFVERFRTPGHVHICSAAPGLLAERQGHTELAVALARLAGIPEAVVGAEILAADADGAMPVEEARALADAQHVPFLEGAELLRAWQSIQEGPDHIAVGV